MKRTALLFLAPFAFFSCKKVTEPPLARIRAVNMQFPIDPGLNPSLTYYIPINDVQINALAQLDLAGIDTANVKSILPNRATMRVLFGNGDLDFIDAVSLRLCSQEQNNENCGKEAFYRDPTPFDVGQELELGPSNIGDIRDLVLQKNLNVQVKLERLRDIPAAAFDVQVEMEFDVR